VTPLRALRLSVWQDGSTPLHYAAAFGRAHVVQALVKAGCSVDARDNASNTPLHLAAGAHLST
jgi:ankyrin repeat protein